jgi:hypothetical protein
VADDMIFISMIAVDVDGSENEILSTSCVLPSASAAAMLDLLLVRYRMVS